MNMIGLILAVAVDFSSGVKNPVLWSDVPDPSLCCDGTNYYMVSTTMHLMPGGPIMRSADMVTWETVSYVFDSIHDSPRYDLAEGGSVYGHGQWASSIRFHDGKFYVWFVCNGGRGFIYTADRAEGPWRLLSRPDYRHDGSLFFDDDGRAYVFSGSGLVSELKGDLSDFIPGTDHYVFDKAKDPDEKALLEGSSVFKENGWYYLMMISMDWGVPGRVRREVCYRSRSLADTNWEKRVILETEFDGFGGVGQGGVVKGPDGNYRAVIFQDRGGIGRVPCVMGVRWEDDWPMLALHHPDAGKKRNTTGLVPNDPSAEWADCSGVSGSDDFSDGKLKLLWQFNHNPVAAGWSLAERPGWLRLRPVGTAKSVFSARNTLTQRMFGPESTGIVRLDVSHMKEGDRAGLAALQGLSGVLGVEVSDGKKFLVFTEEKLTLGENRSIKDESRREVVRIELSDDMLAKTDGVVELKVRGAFRHGEDYAEFAWRTDGDWRPIGGRVPLRFDILTMFMGTKFALYSYSTLNVGGWADFDSFTFERGK